jgi:hypothetical protein
METTKIKANLFIVTDKKGNRYIQSYETIVAHISDGVIYSNGKYSNTTTKHIYHIAKLFNLSIVNSNEKKKFIKLPFGVQC